jgi:hypothetical protein
MTFTITATTVAVITTAQITVDRILWVGNGVASDLCVVKDNSGRIIFSAIAGNAQYNIEEKFDHPTPLNGLNVTTISSGTVIVYYR